MQKCIFLLDINHFFGHAAIDDDILAVDKFVVFFQQIIDRCYDVFGVTDPVAGVLLVILLAKHGFFGDDPAGRYAVYLDMIRLQRVGQGVGQCDQTTFTHRIYLSMGFAHQCTG